MLILISSQAVYGQTTGPEADFTYATRLYADQLYELAAVQFAEYSQKYPESSRAPEALKLSGDSYFKIDQFVNARTQYMALVLKYPDAVGLDEVQYKIGQCFEKDGDYIKAAHSYQQLKSSYPRSKLSETILYQAANMYVLGKDYSSAIELYYMFLDANDQGETAAQARYELARTFHEMGEHERALNEVDKILSRSQIGKLHINSLLTKAEILLDFGRIHDAELIYEKIISDYRANADTYRDEIITTRLELATLDRSKGKFNRSNELLTAIDPEKMDPKVQDRLHILMADNYVDQKQYDNAIKHYLLIDKDSAKLHCNVLLKLGNSYNQAGQYQDAIDSFERLLARCDTVQCDPEQHVCQDAMYQLAQTWSNAGQPSNALYYLNQYLVNYPQSPCSDVVRFKIAEIHETVGNNPERALRLYYEYIDQFPNSRLVDDAQFAVARCYEKMNQFSRARDEYDVLLKNYPGSSYEKVVADRISYIDKYVVTGDMNVLNNFMKLLGDVIHDADDQRHGYKLARIYYTDLKDYSRALELFDTAADHKENSANLDEIEYYIGNCYQLLAEKEWLDTGESSSLRDSSVTRYRRLIATWPDSKWAQDAAFQIIMVDAFFKRTDTERFQHLQNALTSFIATYPQSTHRAEAEYLLGQSYFHANNTDSVNTFSHFQFILKQAQYSERIFDAYHHMAMILKNRNKLQKARNLFTTIIDDQKSSRNKVAALYERGEIGLMVHDEEQAKQDLEKIIDNYFYSPLADSAISKLGKIFIDDQRYLEGLNYFDRLESTHLSTCHWNDAAEQTLSREVFYRKAQLNAFAGDKKKAIDNLQSYLRKFPGDRHTPTILMQLAELYNTDQTQDREIALDYLQQLIEDYPRYDGIGQVHATAGDLLYANQDYGTARNYYLSAIESAVNETSKIHATAQSIICLYLTDKVAAGDQELKQFRREYNNIDEYLGRIELARGDYYYKRMEFSSAEEIYKSARSKFRQIDYGPRAELALGRLYLTLNRDEDALKILTEMPEKYKNHPVIPDVYLSLGEFYYTKARQVENAMLAYKTAIEQPRISDASLAIGMSNLIRCYFDLQMWDRLLSTSRDFLTKFPLSENNFEVRIQIGITYYYLHEYDRAIDYLTKLKYEADSENEPRIQYWIGDCYMEKGQYEKAISEYLKVKYLSKPTKLNWAVTAQYKAGIAYMKLGNMDAATKIFKKIIVEQGVASPFGKGAQKKLEEIEGLN